ncbi:hypothetical protein ACQ4PT_066337 [Festuca glaucescens]
MEGHGSAPEDRWAGKDPATEETIDEKIGRLKLTEAESKKLVLDDREISDNVVRVDVNKQGLTSGGFLREQVWINIDVPLRRCIAIDSSRRESCDWYELEYEDLPYFCFACGLIGHSDIFCPNPGERDELGRWPYGPSLRAPDAKKSRDQYTRAGPENASRTYRDATAEGSGTEYNAPIPPGHANGGRGRGSDGGRGGRTRSRGNLQTYRRLDMPPADISNQTNGAMDVDGRMVVYDPFVGGSKRDSTEVPRARSEAPSHDAKKSKGNLTESENSATAAPQLHQPQ